MAFDPNASQLNQEQIIQQCFDPVNKALRTDATVQVDTINANLTVDIKASSGDNIAVASQDGTKYLVINSDGSINTDITSSALPTNAAQENGGHLASIDSKIPSNLTVNSSRLLVDNSGVTQPVSQVTTPWIISGTVSANQSGIWNINNITGTISLPTGASTSALQITGNASLSSIDSKIPSGLTVSSSRLLVDGSGVTQPISGSVSVSNFPATQAVTQSTSPWVISGTVSANQSGTWNINNITGSITLPTNAAQETGGHLASIDSKLNSLGQKTMAASAPVVIASDQSAIPVTQSGTWNINNISGTISLPTGASTAANQTTIITDLNTIDTDIKASQPRKLQDGAGNNITSQVNGSQRALDVGIDVAGVQVDPRQIRALTSSDVVTANQGGTWTVQPGNTANTTPWLVTDSSDGPVTPGTVANKSSLIGGQYNTTLPTLTNGQQSALQTDSTGLLRVDATITNVTSTGMEAFSSQIKIEPQFTLIAIPSSVTYTTLYTYSGTGYFLGFNFEYSANRGVTKFVIDGNTIMDGFDTNTLNGLVAASFNTARIQNGSGIMTQASNLGFSLKHPIKFTSSVTISARSSGAALNFVQGIVYIQKDT